MVSAGPALTRASPSVPISAASMPSSEVPLINPIARHVRAAADGPLGMLMLDDDPMSTPRPRFLAAALERGFVHQCTDLEALAARLGEGPVAAYVGYDCTADSLHVGSLLSIMLLRHFQKCGHKPIV